MALILPTLRQLQFFVALAETLSFQHASENCHIAQSTLSAGLSELESVLGEILFERDRRKVRITRMGQDLLPLARSILEDSENLVRIAQRHRAPLTSTLALGIIPTIAPYLLPKILPALQTAYPELDLRLKEDITKRQLDALRERTLDVVLMALPYDTPQMEQLVLWTEPFFLVRAGERDYRTPDAIQLDALKDETILLLDDGHCLRDHIISACQLGSNIAQRKTLGATSLQTLVQMVQNGYGATLLPAMALDPSHLPSGLIIQRFHNPQPTRKIGLVWRKGDPREEEFRLLGEFIKQIA